MSLEKVEYRHKLIENLIKEAHDFKRFSSEFEDDNDWAGAKVTLDNLIAFERLIRAEKIFLKTFYAMDDTRCSYRDEEGKLLTIFLSDGMYAFVHEVLLPDLEYMFKVLNEWGFRTEFGEKFRKFVSKRLDRLIKKYQALYDMRGL